MKNSYILYRCGVKIKQELVKILIGDRNHWDFLSIRSKSIKMKRIQEPRKKIGKK